MYIPIRTCISAVHTSQYTSTVSAGLSGLDGLCLEGAYLCILFTQAFLQDLAQLATLSLGCITQHHAVLPNSILFELFIYTFCSSVRKYVVCNVMPIQCQHHSDREGFRLYQYIEYITLSKGS